MLHLTDAVDNPVSPLLCCAYLIGVQQGPALTLVLPLCEYGVAFHRPSLAALRRHRFAAVVEVVLALFVIICS